MKKIIVYGTLRKGLGNHKVFLKDSDFRGEYILKGYEMYDLGSYPLIIKSEESSIRVEVYEVYDEVFDKIDLMEKYAGYSCKLERINDFVGGHIYFFPREDFEPLNCRLKLKKIDGGDYTDYLLTKQITTINTKPKEDIKENGKD